MAVYLLCLKDIDLPDYAQFFFEHVICKHCIPGNIATDHGTQYTNQFWTRVCSRLHTDYRLLTACHIQRDGHTVHEHQTMEEYHQQQL